MSEYSDQFKRACDLFGQEDFEAAQKSFEALQSSGGLGSSQLLDCSFNAASCSASLGHFEEALKKFDSLNTYGARYNKALCNYKLGNFGEALDALDDLLADFYDETNPEIAIDGRKTMPLVKCLNLKSAILFKLNDSTSDEALKLVDSSETQDQDQSSDDGVILHNRSIYTGNTESAIEGLRHLLHLAADGEGLPAKKIPPETVDNLLRLLLIRGDHEGTNEMIDKYRHHLSQNGDLLELYEIVANRTRFSDKTACKKLEILLEKCIGELNGQSESKATNLHDLIASTTKQLALILWENNQYSHLERILLKVEAILGGSQFWPIWFAHTLFMQDNRFEECCFLYEKLIASTRSDGGDLLAIDPIVMANLCVAYLLTGRNDSAESLIKEIETQESNHPVATGPNLNLTYSCIVNLTIGQLYCVKLNFSFGLLRIIKSLEPLDERLTSETWLICKRCILSLLDSHCKSMIYVGDDLFDQIISFLCDCEGKGLLVEAAPCYKISLDLERELNEHDKSILMGRNSVTYEARYLRSLILAVLHD